MGGKEPAREDRRYDVARSDQRQGFERDRDRLLYSSAFHRLSGITQIVRAGEADFFHTRQQHTIKVAQVGRRLAQKVCEDQPELAAVHGVEPEVVEAACLAHDLGHPPFGHIGEYALNDLVERHDDPDGFEGNAQSFRIVTKLAVRFDTKNGLDLTRATLGALLKYPWLRDKNTPGRSKKWSAYKSEEADFTFARELHADHHEQTAEAALMDWADDIAYSVHDLEDFHRCGAIPWHIIFDDRKEQDIIDRTLSKWYNAPSDGDAMLRQALRRLSKLFNYSFEALIKEPYDGSREHRRMLRTLTSSLIGRYVRATKLSDELNGEPLANEVNARVEVLLLKQITRDYIISNPSLAAQQRGQRKIIEDLFQAIIEDSEGGKVDGYPNFLPIRLRYLWQLDGDSVARFAADCIASLTEGQAVALHGRLFGSAAGSVLDPIVR